MNGEMTIVKWMIRVVPGTLDGMPGLARFRCVCDDCQSFDD